MIDTERFLNFLHSLPDLLVYLFLGLCAYVENIFPPIPGDTITAFGAFMVGIGKLDFLWVYLSTTVGSLLGFLTLFKLGEILGRRFFIEKDYPFLRARDLLRAERWFAKYGYFLVAMNRFLPGVRSAVSLAGGVARLKPVWVVLLALLSCALWNLIWILAGLYLGSHWQEVEAGLSLLLMKYNLLVLILFALLALLIIFKRVTRARKGEGRGEIFERDEKRSI